MSENKDGGSTALCAINVRRFLYIINVGDSSCVLVKNNFESYKLNNEHIPLREDEAKRIKEKGSVIYKK